MRFKLPIHIDLLLLLSQTIYPVTHHPLLWLVMPFFAAAKEVTITNAVQNDINGSQTNNYFPGQAQNAAAYAGITAQQQEIIGTTTTKGNRDPDALGNYASSADREQAFPSRFNMLAPLIRRVKLFPQWPLLWLIRTSTPWPPPHLFKTSPLRFHLLLSKSWLAMRLLNQPWPEYSSGAGGSS